MPIFKRKKDPFSPTRYGDVFRSARQRERKHLRRRWQWMLLGVFLLIAAVAGYGAYSYFSVQGDVQEPFEEDVTERADRDDPFNVLIVGSDSRTGLTEEEQHDLGANAIPGQRADTLVLAHIDPETNKVTMVQFPRDLWVPIDGGEPNKINSALEEGARPLVRTVKDLTALRIHHYVQVNIAGFRDLVDAIDGVDVCIPEPIEFDEQTGLQVTEEEVGMVHFDGDRALRFVRSRAFATGDFERIQNQQKFIAAALDKILSTSTLLQPGRVKSLADVARRNVVVDQNTTLLGLADIGEKLRSFNPSTYEAYTAPNTGVATITVGGTDVSIVDPDDKAMDMLFSAVAANESPAEADGVPDVAPSTIRVGVYNGVGLEQAVAGPAGEDLKAATDLGDGPVNIVDTANAKHFRYRGTTIVHNQDEPEAERMAELVAAAIPDATVETGRTKPDVDVAVIVGKGKFRTQRIVQLLPIPIPSPGELPEACRDDVQAGG
ncbi:MAG: LCP family protein [Actinomycetota bacterium]